MEIVIRPANWNGWEGINEATAHCRCGFTYRIRMKFKNETGGLMRIHDRVCPSCKTTDTRKVESDPETFTLGS